jgi:hypothetical protein
MNRKNNQLIISLLVCVAIIIAATACMYGRKGEQRQSDAMANISQGDQKLRVSIPDATWEPEFFEFIETYIKQINLPSLRTIVLPNKDDLEVRFWADLRPNKLDAFVLRRINNQWSAVHVKGPYKHQGISPTKKNLAKPKSGWDGAWDKLVGAGILTLPDASEVKCNVVMIDGMVFIIETNFKWHYRTYAYGNPQEAKCNEAKQMISIIQIIHDEFALE